MSKNKWINLSKFWKWGSVLFMIATLSYFAWAGYRGIDRLDIAIVLLGIVVVLALQIEYLLFRYFEHKKIDAKRW